MTDASASQKIPLVFFRTAAGSEPVRGMVEGVAEGRASRGRTGPVTGAMAVASGYAAVPAVGERPMGNSDGPADGAHSTCNRLPLRRASGGVAWVHQEDAGNAR